MGLPSAVCEQLSCCGRHPQRAGPCHSPCSHQARHGLGQRQCAAALRRRSLLLPWPRRELQHWPQEGRVAAAPGRSRRTAGHIAGPAHGQGCCIGVQLRQLHLGRCHGSSTRQSGGEQWMPQARCTLCLVATSIRWPSVACNAGSGHQSRSLQNWAHWQAPPLRSSCSTSSKTSSINRRRVAALHRSRSQNQMLCPRPMAMCSSNASCLLELPHSEYRTNGRMRCRYRYLVGTYLQVTIRQSKIEGYVPIFKIFIRLSDSVLRCAALRCCAVCPGLPIPH